MREVEKTTDWRDVCTWRRRPVLRRRKRDERGAVLVEAAIVAMLLMLITAGIVEYGQLFASTINTSGAVRSAARMGAVTPATGAATDDYSIIQALRARAGGARTDFDRVVIYRSDDVNGKVPPSCTSGPPSPAALCNVYLASDLTKTKAQLDALPASQRTWPESSRSPGADYIGVWVSVNRTRIFGNFVPSPTSYRDTFVVQIAPKYSPTTPGGWDSHVTTDPGWNDDWFCWNGTCEDGTGDSGTGGGTGGST